MSTKLWKRWMDTSSLRHLPAFLFLVLLYVNIESSPPSGRLSTGEYLARSTGNNLDVLAFHMWQLERVIVLCSIAIVVAVGAASVRSDAKADS